ncbi:MAG: hypothetical protein J5830_05010 [Clostridia bacterium]|nr:hypothetical protein [Clostridia bacterium]
MRKIKKKRFLCLLSAMVFALAALVSCGGNTGGETTETHETPGTDAKGQSLIDSVDKKDYDGATFGFLTIGSSERYCKEILPDAEDDSDPIYAAVLKRNRAIESYLGITITEFPSADPINDAITCVISGDSEWDVFNLYQHGCMNLVTLGYARDWNELDIDLSKPWWNRKAIQGLAVNGHLPVMSGSILISEIEAIVGMVYNQRLYDKFNIDTDIYKEVADGNWTLDSFIALANRGKEDLNADGLYTIGDDIVGYAADKHSMAMNWPFATGLVQARIKDGKYEVNISKTKTLTLLEKLKEFFDSGTADQSVELLDDVVFFKDDKVFICAITLYNLEYLRAMEADYGVIPYPKFDEQQKNYVTHVGGAAPIMVLPFNTSKKTEFTSDVLSALCEHSYKTVRPAYYDVTLQEKGTRDEQSKKVLDTLLDARTYDFAYINAKGYAWIVGEMVASGNTNFERIWAGQGSRQLASLQEIVDELIENY